MWGVYSQIFFGPAFISAWGVNILTVTLSEAVLCFIPGVLLVTALQKSGAASRLGANV